MFKDVSGPSLQDIQDAANLLYGEALNRGGQVEVTRDDEKQWSLMNQAGEWLTEQGMGRMDFRTTKSFVYCVN